MTLNKRKFYHVTLYETWAHIKADGFIDPTKSTGKRPFSYFVKSLYVPWAMTHVMYRHSCTLDDLIIIQVDGYISDFWQVNGQPLFACYKPQVPIKTFDPQDWMRIAEDNIQRSGLEIQYHDWYAGLKAVMNGGERPKRKWGKATGDPTPRTAYRRNAKKDSE